MSCFFDSQCIYNACLERGAACLHMVQLVPLPSQNHIRSKDITGAPKFRHSSPDPTTPIWFEFDAGQSQTLADPTAPLATCCVQRHSRTTTISRSTQPCIPPWSLNRVPASAGVRAGMSPLPGWQVTLCDPIWHVSSCSGVATLRTAIHLLLTYLLTYWLTYKSTSAVAEGPRDATCQLKPCEMLHTCSSNYTWKALQQANDLQGHARSLETARNDKSYDNSY